MLEAPGEAGDDALAVGSPKFVGACANDDIVAADIIGNMLVKAGFKPADTVKGVIRIVNFGRVRATAKIIARDTSFFHPFDDFPL